MRSYRHRFTLTAFIFLTTGISALCQPPTKGQASASEDNRDAKAISSPEDRGFHLSGDTIRIRFSVYKYFPFIEATVNGVKGKLMFDTGAGSGLELDDRVLQLGNGKIIGQGFVGSGQKFEQSRYDTIGQISLDNGRLKFVNAGPITGHDFSYMRSITTDILGLVGYNFFKGYLFKLDYKAGVITFYKSTNARTQSRDFLKNERSIAVLDFETRRLPNHPVIKKVTTADTLAISFDTGQLGTLSLSDQVKKNWLESRELVTHDDDEVAELRSFWLPSMDAPLTLKTHLYSLQAASGANNAIGITETNSLTLGYSFLNQYKTVWDFGSKKIYVLKR
jgi:hypothetical protein